MMIYNNRIDENITPDNSALQLFCLEFRMIRGYASLHVRLGLDLP